MARPRLTPRKPAASSALSTRFAAALAALGWRKDARAALAVSGGGDSLGLMLLFADWARQNAAPKPVVLIVDHGLRAESPREAAQVAKWAKRAGLEAQVLKNPGKRPKADIEARAREARYRLMGEWCRAHDFGALFLAHTKEDQAETFLLRLARGSGVDGLSAMRPQAHFPLSNFSKISLYRPLLGFTRNELRGFLAERGQTWLEDPMNQDPRFARTRLRAIFPILEAAGLSATRIAAAAGHLSRAREALDDATANLVALAVKFDSAGYALIDADKIARAPREVALRALARVLMAVSGENYRPRFERLEQLLNALAACKLSGGRTLHGCRVTPAPKAWRSFGDATLLIAREARAASRAPQVLLAPGATVIWDGRFRLMLAADAMSSFRVTALGEEPSFAEKLASVPAPARAGLPVLKRGQKLAAVPHAAEGGIGGLAVGFLPCDPAH